MRTPDDTPPSAYTPPERAEAEARLAEEQQVWLALDDDEFDRFMQEGDRPLDWDA
jgi:hypothetical protein